MKTISILFITIISLMLSGCSPKLTQSFIDKYDTPKLTNECPDFSGVYESDEYVEPFYNDDISNVIIEYDKKLSIGTFTIAIHHVNQTVAVEVYENNKLISKYISKNIFQTINNKYNTKYKTGGCYNKSFFRRSYYVSHRPEWGGGTRSFYEQKISKITNNNIELTYRNKKAWHGPFGTTEEYEPYTKTFILKRIK